MNQKTIDLLTIAFRSITPKKPRSIADEYMEKFWYELGWNDCKEQIRQNRKEYIEKLKHL